jgi:hypothetical protein
LVATKNEQRNNKEQEMKEKQKRTYLCNSDDKLFKMLLDYKERFLKTQTKKNQKKNHNVNVDCEM